MEKEELESSLQTVIRRIERLEENRGLVQPTVQAVHAGTFQAEETGSSSSHAHQRSRVLPFRPPMRTGRPLATPFPPHTSSHMAAVNQDFRWELNTLHCRLCVGFF